MTVFKILRPAEWAAFRAQGRFAGSPDDLRDGFVHLSTRAQLEGTLARHFAGEAGLVLVALDRERLGAELRMEPSRGGEDFPHLFRALDMADVTGAQELSPQGGRHLNPAP